MYTPALKWVKVVENGIYSNDASLHTPVLVEETLSWLRPKAGGVYMDCTVGYAGLASRILQETGPDGVLIGIDRDQVAVDAACGRLQAVEGRVYLRRGNFSDLKTHLSYFGFSALDGVVFDLGVSSPQLNRAERGFSFLVDGPLDMRMDQSASRTAADLLRELPEGELADMIYHFGEERYSRRIARAIVSERTRRPLETTAQLASLIVRAVPAAYRHGRIHCATRSFQALRIAVNQELDVLEPSLRAAVDVLSPNGRLCVISFHSLEDRIVKHTFRDLSQQQNAIFNTLTKKPIMASLEECRSNPRARSAKLRAGERHSRERAA